MKIAILGAGFCGLATALHLIKKGARDLVLFDPLGIGKGASGIAAGLLHPYAGARATKNLDADSGLTATLSLIQIAEAALNSPVITSKGLFRPAVSSMQKKDFAETALLYPDVHWLTAETCKLQYGLDQPHPGIFIDSAITIDCEKYLEGMWKTASEAGVSFEKKAIHSLEELHDFDRILITVGAAVKSLPELQNIKITPIKGQVLELDWPKERPPLSFPISSKAYLLRQPDGMKCIAGATFERNYLSEGPDLIVATNDILPKIQEIFPEINSAHITGCRSGIRASAARHQPLMTQVNQKSWILTGMGSKGLLYHALYAEKLAICCLQLPFLG